MVQILWELDGRTNDGCLDLNEFIDRMCWHAPYPMKELMAKYERSKANRCDIIFRVTLKIASLVPLTRKNQSRSTHEKLIQSLQQSDAVYCDKISETAAVSEQTTKVSSVAKSNPNEKLVAQMNFRYEPKFMGPKGGYRDWDAIGLALKSNDSTFNSRNMSSTGLWPIKPAMKQQLESRQQSHIQTMSRGTFSAEKVLDNLKVPKLAEDFRPSFTISSDKMRSDGRSMARHHFGFEIATCSPVLSPVIPVPDFPDVEKKESDSPENCHTEHSHIRLSCASDKCDARLAVDSRSFKILNSFGSDDHMMWHQLSASEPMLQSFLQTSLGPNQGIHVPTSCFPGKVLEDKPVILRGLSNIASVSLKVQKDLSLLSRQLQTTHCLDLSEINLLISQHNISNEVIQAEENENNVSEGKSDGDLQVCPAHQYRLRNVKSLIAGFQSPGDSEKVHSCCLKIQSLGFLFLPHCIFCRSTSTAKQKTQTLQIRFNNLVLRMREDCMGWLLDQQSF